MFPTPQPITHPPQGVSLLGIWKMQASPSICYIQVCWADRQVDRCLNRNGCGLKRMTSGTQSLEGKEVVFWWECYVYVSETIRAACHPLVEYQECPYSCLRVCLSSVTSWVFVMEPGNVTVGSQRMHSSCYLKNGKTCSGKQEAFHSKH